MLQSERERQIFKVIEEQPGISLRALMRKTGIWQGTLTPTLAYLTTEGFISETKDGQYRRFKLTSKGYQNLKQLTSPDFLVYLKDTKEGRKLLEEIVDTRKSLEADRKTIRQLREQVEDLELDQKFFAIRYRYDFFRQRMKDHRSELQTQKMSKRKVAEAERFIGRVENLLDRIANGYGKEYTTEEARRKAEEWWTIYDLATSYNIHISYLLHPWKVDAAMREWVPPGITREEYEGQKRQRRAELAALERTLFPSKGDKTQKTTSHEKRRQNLANASNG